MRKGEEKENFLLFFDAYDEYIIIAHDARTYKKSSLPKEECIIVA